MKIQENNQLGFNFRNNEIIKNNVFVTHYNKYFLNRQLDSEAYKYGATELVDFIYNPSPEQWEKMKNNKLFSDVEHLSYPKHHFYYFSDNAIQASKTIKIDLNKFEPGILKELPENKSCTFLCGANLSFKYWYKNGQMLCMIMETKQTTQGQMFNYLNFRLRLTDNSYNFPDSDNPHTVGWKETYFIQFLQMLFFVEFSQAEFVLLKPNQNNGASKKQGKILNDSRLDVTVVNSSWNKIYINNEGFSVSPHLRWQRCGPNNTQQKLIVISEFKKEGYVRKGLGTLNKNINQDKL
jgi:hypothetical protein